MPRRNRLERELLALLKDLMSPESKIYCTMIKAWRREARARVLRRMFTKRLGRPLTLLEISTLDRRMKRSGLSAVEDVLLSPTSGRLASPGRLAAWLAAPDQR